jgi:hypothetical protein
VSPSIPSWWEFALLALAAFRVYRLIAEDTILDRPRRRILRLGRDWEKQGDPVPENYRAEWGTFLTCPWCAGFWITLAWWAAWLISEEWATWAAVPWAASAVVALVAKNLDAEE